MIVFTRTLVVVFLLLTVGYSTKAQLTREIEVKLNKAMQKAVAADYNYPESSLESAVENKFSKASFGKGKKKSGYRVYSEILWPEVAANDKIDVWVKMDERKETSTLTILISKGYNNFISSATDAAVVENLKTFMNNLNADIAAVDLSKRIEAQMKVVKSLEENHESLKKEGEKLQREKRKTEMQIEDNLKAQEKFAAETENERSKLDGLRTQAGK